MKNVYTFYWKDGHRSIIRADAVETAFGRLGFSSGALAAVDFYVQNSNDRRWDTEQCKWVQRHSTGGFTYHNKKAADAAIPLLPEQLLKDLRQVQEIRWTQPNTKHLVVLRSTVGQYATLGWLIHYEVYCAEPTGEEIDGQLSYAVIGALNFSLSDPDAAIRAFLYYVESGTYHRNDVVPGACSLEDIQDELDRGIVLP